MEHFDALSRALEGWFDRPLGDLSDATRKRVEQEFSPMPWDQLTADQRRSVALQLDYQHDPATEQDRQFWWDFFQRVDELKKQVAEWESVATPTAAELAKKETRLVELQQELTRMEASQRAARGDYVPERKPSRKKRGSLAAEPAPSVRYIAYPKAMQQLAHRLGASPDELAAWIWTGPEDGGIAAYVNANELDSPPRFSYSYFVGTSDYIAPLMGCWFKADDVDQFEPTDRYIVGAALMERWIQQPGLNAAAFIHAKIAESRLLDIHPIYGGTRGTFSENSDWPPLESGLFSLSLVKQIEAEDFQEFSPEESPTTLAPAASEPESNAHTLPLAHAPKREKSQKSTLRQDAAKLVTQSLYKGWQKAYRTLVKRHPNKSDVWLSKEISKLPIAKGRNSETIRKHMKS